eukprot:CAMPEP_0196678364 /NCGR_PEP_ID=MMETSP1090-20130531/6289_1 /TAXON_ID=37098 /ORGANISM="Isochrysis sp, Strain CCMP1244" /LENGTH=75 /DNA_ID=CAMNT_0042016501 /DNA_START=345 /DNA_END=572 /DNA_ORIENTATION=-
MLGKAGAAERRFPTRCSLSSSSLPPSPPPSLSRDDEPVGSSGSTGSLQTAQLNGNAVTRRVSHGATQVFGNDDEF